MTTIAAAGLIDPYEVPSSPSPSPPPPPPPRKRARGAIPKPKPPPEPATAWEAVWSAYNAVRQKYPTLQSRPTARSVRGLLDLPVVRPLRYDRQSVRRSDFNLPPGAPQSGNRNLKAALLQVSSAAAQQSCSRCVQHKNLWDVCVDTGEGCCAGCLCNGQKSNCAFPDVQDEGGEGEGEGAEGQEEGQEGGENGLPFLEDIPEEAPEPQVHGGKSSLGQEASASVRPTDAERRLQLDAMTDVERADALHKAVQDLRLLYERRAPEAGSDEDEDKDTAAPTTTTITNTNKTNDDDDDDMGDDFGRFIGNEIEDGDACIEAMLDWAANGMNMDSNE
ncbi:hypothetical protein PFICI_06479 [Pestalotiopsis fici W106-1]|uniref:Uncharacterized protein n=1 Tax=Pestalotiopsis fici (strain W106-1 / CGMCC3.15140) TaxID=1229662 RepID=W3X7V4_PESFW|nr:uncharacterized protein PFICI_06479 [Pestalotiopsis fici W106-1]ETS81477.1 hypothetical protein PFICI_06479 [Pestalotiopsis fici W106-1]